MAETIMFRLESQPGLMVGVTPNATIVLQLTEVKQRIAIPDPAELQQVIEQALATRRDVARGLYPLPARLRQILAAASPEGLLFPQIMHQVLGLSWREPEAYEVTAELRQMERDGTARRLIAQPGGVRWAPKSTS